MAGSEAYGPKRESAERAAPPRVSVIIPVWDDARRLQKALQALACQSYPREAYEVIVVDNGSDPLLDEIAVGDPSLVLLREPRPGSYAARNLALTRATGAVLVFTDADCIPAENWIEEGVKALTAEPGLGLVGGRVELFFHDPTRPTAVELYERATAFRQRDYIELNHFASTANAFTFRAVVDAVGTFDDGLLSGGDREWGKRVYAAGYRQAYSERAWVAHPARRGLRELYLRTARMAGGLFGKRKSSLHDEVQPPYDEHRSLGHLARALARHLWPATSLRTIRETPRLDGSRQRLLASLIAFFVSYALLVERLRLALGRPPRRR